MSEMKAFQELCQRATARPWTEMPPITVDRAEPKTCFANFQLLTIAANHVQELVATVQHLLLGAAELRDLCPGCKEAEALLAKIEEEVKL